MSDRGGFLEGNAPTTGGGGGGGGTQGPRGLPGADGADGLSVEIQYAASNEDTSFHNDLRSGDLFIRFRVGSTASWGPGHRFVGEDGADGAAGADGASVQMQVSADGVNYQDAPIANQTHVRFRVGTGIWQAFRVTQSGGGGSTTLTGDDIVGLLEALPAGRRLSYLRLDDTPTIPAAPTAKSITDLIEAAPEAEKLDWVSGITNKPTIPTSGGGSTNAIVPEGTALPTANVMDGMLFYVDNDMEQNMYRADISRGVNKYATLTFPVVTDGGNTFDNNFISRWVAGTSTAVGDVNDILHSIVYDDDNGLIYVYIKSSSNIVPTAITIGFVRVARDTTTAFLVSGATGYSFRVPTPAANMFPQSGSPAAIQVGVFYDDAGTERALLTSTSSVLVTTWQNLTSAIGAALTRVDMVKIATVLKLAAINGFASSKLTSIVDTLPASGNDGDVVLRLEDSSFHFWGDVDTGHVCLTLGTFRQGGEDWYGWISSRYTGTAFEPTVGGVVAGTLPSDFSAIFYNKENNRSALTVRDENTLSGTSAASVRINGTTYPLVNGVATNIPDLPTSGTLDISILDAAGNALTSRTEKQWQQVTKNVVPIELLPQVSIAADMNFPVSKNNTSGRATLNDLLILFGLSGYNQLVRDVEMLKAHQSSDLDNLFDVNTETSPATEGLTFPPVVSTAVKPIGGKYGGEDARTNRNNRYASGLEGTLNAEAIKTAVATYNATYANFFSDASDSRNPFRAERFKSSINGEVGFRSITGTDPLGDNLQLFGSISYVLDEPLIGLSVPDIKVMRMLQTVIGLNSQEGLYINRKRKTTQPSGAMNIDVGILNYVPALKKTLSHNAASGTLEREADYWPASRFHGINGAVTIKLHAELWLSSDTAALGTNRGVQIGTITFPNTNEGTTQTITLNHPAINGGLHSKTFTFTWHVENGVKNLRMTADIAHNEVYSVWITQSQFTQQRTQEATFSHVPVNMESQVPLDPNGFEDPSRYYALGTGINNITWAFTEEILGDTAADPLMSIMIVHNGVYKGVHPLGQKRSELVGNSITYGDGVARSAKMHCANATVWEYADQYGFNADELVRMNQHIGNDMGLLQHHSGVVTTELNIRATTVKVNGVAIPSGPRPIDKVFETTRADRSDAAIRVQLSANWKTRKILSVIGDNNAVDLFHSTMLIDAFRYFKTGDRIRMQGNEDIRILITNAGQPNETTTIEIWDSEARIYQVLLSD